MADSILVGKATLKDSLKVTCESGAHVFYCDEPKSSGGTDEGMNPLEAFLCSLGACKSVISKMASSYTFKTSASKEDIEKLVEYVDAHCPVMDTVVNSPSHSHKVVIL